LEEPLEWNSTLLKGDVVGDLRKLRHQPGDTLLIYGSGALVDTLMRHDLTDAAGSRLRHDLASWRCGHR
jgi:dihydrofolate reductase